MKLTEAASSRLPCVSAFISEIAFYLRQDINTRDSSDLVVVENPKKGEFKESERSHSAKCTQEIYSYLFAAVMYRPNMCFGLLFLCSKGESLFISVDSHAALLFAQNREEASGNAFLSFVRVRMTHFCLKIESFRLRFAENRRKVSELEERKEIVGVVATASLANWIIAHN